MKLKPFIPQFYKKPCDSHPDQMLRGISPKTKILNHNWIILNFFHFNLKKGNVGNWGARLRDNGEIKPIFGNYFCVVIARE